jgi:hypothetical protein
MRPLAALAALAMALLLVAGCAGSLRIGGPPTGIPKCPAPAGWSTDDDVSAVVLMAQAVPSASWLPCIASLRVGFGFDRLDTHDGRGHFWLKSGHDGDHAIGVTLTRRCDVHGAVEQASRHIGISRYARVDSTGSKYAGEWYYRFAGGCITYQFNLHSKAGDESIAAISAGLDFVSRDTVRRWVREHSDGRLDLDPPSSHTTS